MPEERLTEHIMEISQREFPNVQIQIKNKFRAIRTSLEGIGPFRVEPNAQRILIQFSCKF